MRNIAEIIEDERKGKELSQTERQRSIAYTQGKYDAVRELKIGKDSKINKVLEEIKANIIIESFPEDEKRSSFKIVYLKDVIDIIDKYKE